MKESFNNRPLSPHLQVYRLPLTAIVSITHRMTGVALVFGMLYLVLWLVGIASGPEQFLETQSFLDSILGRMILFFFSFALFFHFVHGIRHLFWDAGYTFERDEMDRWATVEIIVSVGLTLFVWFIRLLT